MLNAYFDIQTPFKIIGPYQGSRTLRYVGLGKELRRNTRVGSLAWSVRELIKVRGGRALHSQIQTELALLCWNKFPSGYSTKKAKLRVKRAINKMLEDEILVRVE